MVGACLEKVNNIQERQSNAKWPISRSFEGPNQDGQDDTRQIVLGGQIQTPTVCILDLPASAADLATPPNH